MHEQQRVSPDLSLELEFRNRGMVCVGVDEVGSGCLAGPVVTAAVALPEFILQAGLPQTKVKSKKKEPKTSISESPYWWAHLNDSKQVEPEVREELSVLLWKHAQIQVTWCLPEEVDEYNILHASMIAMRKALAPFAGLAQVVLVDGRNNPYKSLFRAKPGEAYHLGFKHIETIVKGDQKSLSIAAASIVAKVYRDRWMTELDSLIPGYGFARHKGYSTRAHYEALDRLGPSIIHRKSFGPIKEFGGSEDCTSDVDGKQTELFS